MTWLGTGPIPQDLQGILVDTEQRSVESALRQHLSTQGLMAHLNLRVTFDQGILIYTIDTDPRAVPFLFQMGE